MTTFRELLPILTTHGEVFKKQTQKAIKLNVQIRRRGTSGTSGSGAPAPPVYFDGGG